MNNRFFSARKIAFMALFLALIIIGAFIKIPAPPIPYTLQSAFVLMAGIVLGGLECFVLVIIYILMGLVGLPIFASGGGFGYVLYPSFGFMIGFALGGLVSGIIVGKKQKISVYRLIASVLVGTIIIYACGILYYFPLKAFYLGGEIDVWSVFMSFWIIFIPSDIVKGIVVVTASKFLRPIICKSSDK